jgi:hypothetical protein
MNAAPVPWLPPPQDGEVERVIAAFAARWAQEWFTPPCDIRIKRYPGRRSDEFEWSGVSGAAVGVGGTTRLKLGLAVVGGEADLDNPRDRAVLERVAKAAVADLAGRLGELAVSYAQPAPLPATDARPVLRLSLGDDSWSILLSLGVYTETALRKLSAGQSRQPSLAKLSDALAPERVAIGCHIGGATLLASEVAGLAKGDLITLDRLITEDLPLTVATAVTSSGTAKLVHDGTGAVVRITQAINSNLSR